MTYDFDAAVARIRAGYRSARTCPLVGRGLVARVRAAERAARAGLMPLDRAERIAAEAEGASFMFAPVPAPGRRGLARLVALVLAGLPVLAVGAERTWPTAASRWRLDVQQPAGPGRTRYSSVYAVPAGRGGWAVAVECGEHDSRSGRVLSRVTGTGRGELGRGAGMGGYFDGADGFGGSYVVDLPPGDGLNVPAQFTDRRCASGIGHFSSGD